MTEKVGNKRRKGEEEGKDSFYVPETSQLPEFVLRRGVPEKSDAFFQNRPDELLPFPRDDAGPRFIFRIMWGSHESRITLEAHWLNPDLPLPFT